MPSCRLIILLNEVGSLFGILGSVRLVCVLCRLNPAVMHFSQCQ